MTDEQLINYCESHAKTERALFSIEHINRMYSLAGMENMVEPIMPGQKRFVSMHEEMEALCLAARNLAKNDNGK